MKENVIYIKNSAILQCNNDLTKGQATTNKNKQAI